MTERAFLQPETRRAVAYEPVFDIEAYRRLQGLRFQVSVDEYNRLKDQINLRTRHNLETALGERFNVQISQIEYFIENNRLKSAEHDEPFLEIAKRGQRYRLTNGNPHDYAREAVEVLGLKRLEKLISACSDPGSEMTFVVISPRGAEGSDYQHNFFDIYEKEEGEHIKMTRFASKMSYSEFLKAAESIDPLLPTPISPSDDFFLAHPLTTNKTVEEILEILHPDQKAMTQGEYQKILTVCAPLIAAYINNPSTLIYDALLNIADQVVGTIFLGSDPKTAYQNNSFRGQTPISTFTINVDQLINYYGRLPVRQVATGCGIQSGFATASSFQFPVSSFSPFSVAEFAKGGCPECGGQTNHFHCPGCNDQIESGRGITTCPHCGLTKEKAGSQCG